MFPPKEKKIDCWRVSICSWMWWVPHISLKIMSLGAFFPGNKKLRYPEMLVHTFLRFIKYVHFCKNIYN